MFFVFFPSYPYKLFSINCNFKKQLNRALNRSIRYAFQWFWNAKKRFNTLWESSHCANRRTKLRISGRTLRFAMWFIFENTTRKRSWFFQNFRCIVLSTSQKFWSSNFLYVWVHVFMWMFFLKNKIYKNGKTFLFKIIIILADANFFF